MSQGFTVKFYSGGKNGRRFWRFDICSGKIGPVVKSGFLYGTEADAKQRAAEALARLSTPKSRRTGTYEINDPLERPHQSQTHREQIPAPR